MPGLAWPGLTWSGLVWSGLVWSGLVWSDLLRAATRGPLSCAHSLYIRGVGVRYGELRERPVPDLCPSCAGRPSLGRYTPPGPEEALPASSCNWSPAWHELGAHELGARELGARELGARELGARASWVSTSWVYCV